MLDSFFAFSDLPLMILLWIGVLGVALSVVAAGVILVFWAVGRISVPGYTPTILSILFFGSVLIMGQGVVGAYVWRGSENAKTRPLSITAHEERFPHA